MGNYNRVFTRSLTLCKSVIVAMLMIWASTGWAQTFDSLRLNEYFDVIEENGFFMGSVTIMKGDNVLYSREVGLRDVASNIEADANTKYRIGSTTKTFTAVLVMKAVEMEMLDLDQSIASFFPRIQNANEITIRHLLQHRSGIFDFTSDENYLTYYTEPRSRGQLLSIIVDGGSNFIPGERSEYSNSNYLLLTFILEDVFQESYATILAQNITTPLGLNNTYVGGQINPDNDEAYSYKWDEEWVLEPETDLSIPQGAGFIVSTSADLAEFGNALFNHQLVSAENLEAMTTLEESFGLGLTSVPFYELEGYGHSGGIDGFQSALGYFDEEEITYAVTGNAFNMSISDISLSVLSAAYGRRYFIPANGAIFLTTEDLDKYLGLYSSPAYASKLMVVKDGNILIGRTTGDLPSALKVLAEDKFVFGPEWMIVEFFPTENRLTILDNGRKVELVKE